MGARVKRLSTIVSIPTLREAKEQFRINVKVAGEEARRVLGNLITLKQIENPEVRRIAKQIVNNQQAKLKTEVFKPTITSAEKVFKQSLPADIRELSVAEISARQTFGRKEDFQEKIGFTPADFDPTLLTAEEFKREASKITRFVQPSTGEIVRRKLRSAADITKRRIKELIEGSPSDPKGLSGFLGGERKVGDSALPPILQETDKFTVDITKPEGIRTGGTLIFTPREKTFFEKLNINPNDPSAINLKNRVTEIQGKFDQGSISEETANFQLGQASDSFTKTQLRRGLPRDLAFGAALGLISQIPVVGTVVGGALFSDLFLKRKQFKEQFKKFPLESALSTGAFLAGGLVSRGVIGGAKGKAVPELNLDNIPSVSFLSGKQKTKLVDIVGEFDNNFIINQKKGKITDTIAYDILLADGSRYRVLSYTKLDKPVGRGGIRGTQEFIGLELNPKIKGVRVGRGVVVERPEVLFGRGVQVLGSSGADTFTRVIRFKSANTKLGRLAQRVFGSGKVFNIAERSRLVGTRGGLRRRISSVQSEAKLLSVENAKGSLVKKIRQVQDKINKSKKLSLMELKSLINLGRRARGNKPFNEAEFKNAKIGSITDINVVSLLRELKIVSQSKRLAASKTLVERRTFGGIARSRPLVVAPKRIKPRPPRKSNTIAEVRQNVIKISKESKIKSATVQQLEKQVSKAVQNIKNIPSQAAQFAVSLVNKQKNAVQRTIVKTQVKLVAKAAQVLALNQLQSQVGEQARRLRGRILQSTSPLTETRTKQLESLTQKVDLRLRQIQVQKQKLSSVGRERVGRRASPVPTPKLRFTPPFTPGAKEVAGKLRRLVPVKKFRGFDVFVKSRGKFSKVNLRPIPKNKANDLGAWIVDRTTSRQWLIKQSAKTSKRPLIIAPINYAKTTARKYRAFKIRKGVRKPLKNRRIEIKTFAIDTLGEKKQLSAAREIKRLRKRAMRRVPRTRLRSTSTIRRRKNGR